MDFYYPETVNPKELLTNEDRMMSEKAHIYVQS